MGVKVWKGAPLVLHLLFVNNCFLFCRTDDKKIIILKEIIDKYGEVSGQIINFQKSENFFNFMQTIGSTKYLGLPSIIGKKKKMVFYFIKDKI